MRKASATSTSTTSRKRAATRWPARGVIVRLALGGRAALALSLVTPVFGCALGARAEAVEPQPKQKAPAAAAAAEPPVDDSRARRAPVPSKEQITAAEVRVQSPLAELIIAADSPARKSRVATRLLESARQSASPAEQYAALSKARDWAVSAGDPATALAAVTELARRFDVDGLALQSEALGASLAGRATNEAVVLAVEAALKLSDEAERAGRDELALTLADIAYNAARKTRESRWTKRAYRRRSELSEKIKSRRREQRKKPAPVES